MTYHGSPLCKCGSRATRRIHGLRRTCSTCHQTYEYRIKDGELIAMPLKEAAALDRERRSK